LYCEGDIFINSIKKAIEYFNENNEASLKKERNRGERSIEMIKNPKSRVNVYHAPMSPKFRDLKDSFPQKSGTNYTSDCKQDHKNVK